jgi:hypothetical protein
MIGNDTAFGLDRKMHIQESKGMSAGVHAQQMDG